MMGADVRATRLGKAMRSSSPPRRLWRDRSEVHRQVSLSADGKTLTIPRISSRRRQIDLVFVMAKQ